MDNSPLFITGTWRCGSTLISRIMNNHSSMDVSYDTVHFLRFAYKRYDPINQPSNVLRLMEDINSRIQNRYSLNFNIQEAFDDLEEKYTYANVYQVIMRNCMLRRSGKLIWGEKTNLQWRNIPSFFEMFPGGRVIHVVRDPRAVLASWKKFTSAPGNDYLDSIVNSIDSMNKALKYKQIFSDKRYECVLYEDLVSEPEETIRFLCQKINVPFEMSMLDVSRFVNRMGKSWHNNSIYQQKKQEISKDMIDRWQTELTEWEICLVQKIMLEILHEFGYGCIDLTSEDVLLKQAIHEVLNSALASDGLLKFLLIQQGAERYPSDPLVLENWAR
jgi:hypothetical protein